MDQKLKNIKEKEKLESLNGKVQLCIKYQLFSLH